MLYSDDLEAALRWAARCHQGQTRRASGLPYFQHVVAVAMILDRLGYGEEVVIAGLLHDVVEDTEATLDDVRQRFGSTVAELVAQGTEVKLDDQGLKRPWIDRKRDHLAAMVGAPAEARALLLADKLHNLASIARDLHDGRPIWSTFNAPRAQVLWYYREAIETLAKGATEDPRLSPLVEECQRAWERVDQY